MMQKEPGIRFGLLAGLAAIAGVFGAYLIRPAWVLNAGVQWSVLTFWLVGMYLALREEQKTKAPLSLQQALKTAFVVYILAAGLYHLFYFTLFRFIDPGLIDLQREQILATLEQQAGFFGLERTEALREAYENDDFEPKLNDMLFGWAQSLILGFLLSLGLAYLMKEQ